VRRSPDREQDGTATWSLTTLQRSLRAAPDGLPTISTYTIWVVLHEAGLTWQRTRSWCATGKVKRRRKGAVVEITDPDAGPKKHLIERAYREGEALGLAVWGEDEAGPFQTQPTRGASWELAAYPKRQAHQYMRNGTAKALTLFHPATGQVRSKGVRSCTNAVLHPWLKQELAAILDRVPAPEPVVSSEDNRAQWARWQAGLTVRVPLPAELPPLRMLLVLDNLTGHQTPELVRWLFAHGIMPLYTPLGASWLNMTESLQRILSQRALSGQHPETPEQIIDWLETAARAWNRTPAPFEWVGNGLRDGSAPSTGDIDWVAQAPVPGDQFAAGRRRSRNGYLRAK
jgi:hypothetical protein